MVRAWSSPWRRAGWMVAAMNDIQETACASASMSPSALPVRGNSFASGKRFASQNRMPATSVSGRPSISSVGTLPSGLIAR